MLRQPPPMFEFAPPSPHKIVADNHQDFADRIAHAVLLATSIAEIDEIRDANAEGIESLKRLHHGHAICLSGAFTRRRKMLAEQGG